MAKVLKYPLFNGFLCNARQDEVLGQLAQRQQVSRGEVLRRLIDEAETHLVGKDGEGDAATAIDLPAA